MLTVNWTAERGRVVVTLIYSKNRDLVFGMARLWMITVSVTAIVVALALLVPTVSDAAFTRHYLREITNIPGGFKGGLAVDAADNLWVGAGAAGGGKPFSLDEFEYPLGLFAKTVEIEGLEPPENTNHQSVGLTPPSRLAIDDSTGNFYTDASQSLKGYGGSLEYFNTGGTYLGRFAPREDGYVVVYDSPDPSADIVYVASGDNPGDKTISKFNLSGEPVGFSESGKGKDYINGNQITSAPGSFTSGFGNQSPDYVAVDPHGDIYTTASEYETSAHGPIGAILEYAPTGSFIRAISGAETPGLSGRIDTGFGSEVAGLAVDPSNGDVLVALNRIERINGTNIYLEGVIDEFDPSGVFLGQLTESSTGHHLQSAHQLAVDSHGDLYVGDEQAGTVAVFGPAHFLPGVRIAQASSRTRTTAVLNGTVNPEAKVNPEHRGISACSFEYVTEAQFQAEGFGTATKLAPCVPAPGEITPETTEDESWHAVYADIDNLASGTTYRYRLTAAVGGEKGGSNSTAVAAFTAPHVPTVVSAEAANISSAYVELKAGVDPLGAATSYWFQYVDEADYRASGYATAKTTPASTIGSGGPSGSAQENVAQHVGPLAPGTSYVFRVVAQSEIEGATETTYGLDTTFATLPTAYAGLPDNRSYELVTPVNRGGGSDLFGLAPTHEFENRDDGVASDAGNGFLLMSHSDFGPFPGNEGSGYVFSRDPARGWGYTSLVLPSLGVQNVGGLEAVFDPTDFSAVGFNDVVGSRASEGGARQVDVVGPPGGPYATLHVDPAYRGKEHTTGSADFGTRIIGASPDLKHVVLGGHDYTLCPGAEKQKLGEVLCEWAGGHEQVGEETRPQLSLVNANNEGKLLRACGAVLGARSEAGGAHNAVSADGSRVIFTAPDPAAVNLGAGCWNGGTGNAPQLYMRVDGRTIDLSEPEEGVSDPTGQHGVEYVGADEDDSRVYFVTETELTRQAAGLGLHDPELYECEILEEELGDPTCKLTRISAGEPGFSGAERGANVSTVPAVSASGASVYFTAFGALASGAQPLKEENGSSGLVNLYRYASGVTTYIGAVGVNDYMDKYGSCATFAKFQGPSRALCPVASWYTTPDGRYLLFSSWHEQTSYDTAGPTCDFLPASEGGSNGHCTETYRYDAALPVSEGKAGVANNPVCVSCNRSGAPPRSNALFSRSALAGTTSGPVRAMSDGGEYVFFDSADPLVPQAENHTLDVYEWEANGTGGCDLPEGCVHLIGSGSDPGPSFFLGTNPDGSNVFIGTHANLIPSQDTASQGNIYDARICTEAEPCIKPPAGETAQCEGDACQSAPAAPIDATPGSLTFSLSEYLSAAPPTVVAKAKAAPTNAQKLATALKVCRRRHKPQRAKCEAKARKRYGAKAGKSAGKRHVKTSRRAGS
jgi:hypothetical protein